MAAGEGRPAWEQLLAGRCMGGCRMEQQRQLLGAAARTTSSHGRVVRVFGSWPPVEPLCACCPSARTFCCPCCAALDCRSLVLVPPCALPCEGGLGVCVVASSAVSCAVASCVQPVLVGGQPCVWVAGGFACCAPGVGGGCRPSWTRVESASPMAAEAAQGSGLWFSLGGSPRVCS